MCIDVDDEIPVKPEPLDFKARIRQDFAGVSTRIDFLYGPACGLPYRRVGNRVPYLGFHVFYSVAIWPNQSARSKGLRSRARSSAHARTTRSVELIAGSAS